MFSFCPKANFNFTVINYLNLDQSKNLLFGEELKPFSYIFQLYNGSQCSCPCSLGVYFTSATYNTLSKPLAALISNITVIKIKVMNPVTMNIINPQKEYWPSRGIKPPISCSQVLYATN